MDMENVTARKSALETKLSAIVGAPVAITVRGLQAFTISAEGDATAAMEKARAFLGLTGRLSSWSADFDAECDQTCAWFELAA